MWTLLTYSRSVKALAVLAALCAAAPAGAAQCTANQINGRWAFFADDAEGDWTVCFLAVRRNRNLSGICDFQSFGESETISVRGILTVNRACTLAGEFFDGGRLAGTLQADRQGGAGILEGNFGGIHFSLIRRP